MVMGTGIRDFRGVMNGIKYDQLFPDHNSMSNLNVGGQQPILDPNSFANFSYAAPVPGPNPTGSVNTSSPLTTSPPNGTTSSTLLANPEGDSSEDSEIFSDIVLTYISRILMEEDIDEKFDMFQGDPALQEAEKTFYEALGEKYPPSPDQPPLYSSHCSDSPDGSTNHHSGIANSSSRSSVVVDNSWPYDPVEYHQLHAHPLPVDYSSQSSFSSSNSSGVGLEESLLSSLVAPDPLVESQPAWQFRRGVEEARKFLPSDDKLVIDLEANGFSLPRELKEENRLVEVKVEKEEKEYLAPGSRGRKHLHGDDSDLEVGRSNKQSAVYSEGTVRSEMFDEVLLCTKEKCGQDVHLLRAKKENEASKSSQSGHSKGSGGGKGRGKKQLKKEVVDLRTLLIHCAQVVATDDRRSANELLKQIRQHSCSYGDANQRLADCFANGLHARLAGTGSQIYQSLVAKRTSASDILKAYQLYLAACPFKRIFHFFANQTILNVAEKATRVHIVDYGIAFGFQWPCLIQRLSSRPGGPPRLRITGIELPQPGFRPAERIEETGRRLADYARTFNVPFEYQAIASKWENVRVEDLNIDKDEVLIVNCLYRGSHLMDETVVVDSPRNVFLNTVRQMNPAVFIKGIVNGSFSAPFFVTRFREALFHYSAFFDMLETTVPREDEQRLLIEREIFGREALNVIACEGCERVERPETYKQWQARILRAGFKHLPLNADIMKKARDKVRNSYHKDFVIDDDSRWLLQGWKGRILFAISTWKPSDA